MKKSIVLILPLAACFCGVTMAEAIRMSPLSTDASLPVPIVADLPAEPPAPIKKPDFQIESKQVKLIEVVEPPPMPGLPPVEGTITLRVHSVADPGLPDPPQRPTPMENPELLERFAELVEKYEETHLAFVSATVYDRSRTRLTCHPGGRDEKSVTVWSNVDFNHFSGIGSFDATGVDGRLRSYHLLMGIGNVDTELWRAFIASQNIDYLQPVIPALPDGAPAFVIQSDEEPTPRALALVEDLHALYRDQAKPMAQAAAAREQAYEAKKAYLLANPPKPKDVTIHFWKRNP